VRASWGGATPEQVVVVINPSRFPVVPVISGSWLLPTGQFLLTDELTLLLQSILFSIRRAAIRRGSSFLTANSVVSRTI
jgi:hypothetical protein